jgi:tRNA 2-thiouridine synthesizing protein D
MKERTLTLALMDPPYESANSTTALRIISAALEQGINVNVFAYEGAVCLPLKDQAPHAADFFKMATESTNTLVIPTR